MTDREKLTEWLKFFLAAGIDSAPAAEYAVSFVDNRIKKDMLSELDRECCREIGITALGDIMLVLKQAKKVINPKVAEKKEIATSKPFPKSATIIPTSTVAEKKPVRSSAQKIVSQPIDLEEDLIDEEEEEYEAPPKPAAAQSTRAIKSVSPIINQSQKEEVPVQRKRRVLPEHEGGYKIKLPVGITPKTAKLKAEGKITPKLDKATVKYSSGVFSRLGASELDAPTPKPIISKDLIHSSVPNKKTTSFTVTGLGKVSMSNLRKTSKSAVDDRDVVVRLGGVALKALKRPATSTQDSEFTDPDAAPYIGVLKTPTVKRSKIEKRSLASSQPVKESVKTRLGLTTASGNSVKKSASLKARLGTTADSTVSSTSDVRSQSTVSAIKKVKISRPIASRLGMSGVFGRLGNR